MANTPNCPRAHTEYVVPPQESLICQFFKTTPAKNWTLTNFVTANVKTFVTRKTHCRLAYRFRNELQTIAESSTIPRAVRTYAGRLKLAISSEANLPIETVDHDDDNAAGPSNKRVKLGTPPVVTDTAAAISQQAEEEAVSEEENDEDEAEVSSTTTSSDSSYVLSEVAEITEDKLPATKQYYLSTQEIMPDTDKQIYEMYTDITFEERVALSSIVCVYEFPSSMPPLTKFSSDFRNLIIDFRESVTYNVPMDRTLQPRLSAREQHLGDMLLTTSSRIRKQALSKKLNHGKNSELGFIVKEAAPLLEAIFCNSKLTLEWDVTPKCYEKCELNVRFTRHDFVLYAEDGTEIGTGEIKPCHAPDALVEIDQCRIAESCKKQLHRRLLSARSTKELYTYGIMISGHKIVLSALHLTNTGEYRYYTIYDLILPTAKHTYAFMEDTLTQMFHFVQFMESSLLNPQEMHDKLILPDYSSFLKPTVYMVAKEEII